MAKTTQGAGLLTLFAVVGQYVYLKNQEETNELEADARQLTTIANWWYVDQIRDPNDQKAYVNLFGTCQNEAQLLNKACIGYGQLCGEQRSHVNRDGVDAHVGYEEMRHSAGRGDVFKTRQPALYTALCSTAFYFNRFWIDTKVKSLPFMNIFHALIVLYMDMIVNLVIEGKETMTSISGMALFGGIGNSPLVAAMDFFMYQVNGFNDFPGYGQSWHTTPAGNTDAYRSRVHQYKNFDFEFAYWMNSLHYVTFCKSSSIQNWNCGPSCLDFPISGGKRSIIVSDTSDDSNPGFSFAVHMTPGDVEVVNNHFEFPFNAPPAYTLQDSEGENHASAGGYIFFVVRPTTYETMEDWAEKHTFHALDSRDFGCMSRCSVYKTFEDNFGEHVNLLRQTFDAWANLGAAWGFLHGHPSEEEGDFVNNQYAGGSLNAGNDPTAEFLWPQDFFNNFLVLNMAPTVIMTGWSVGATVIPLCALYWDTHFDVSVDGMPTKRLAGPDGTLDTSDDVTSAFRIFFKPASISAIITLGKPRVGDYQFAEFYFGKYGSRSWRIVHWRDPVVHWPMRTHGFVHEAKELWVDHNGNGQLCWQTTEDMLCSFQVMVGNMNDHFSYFGGQQHSFASISASACEFENPTDIDFESDIIKYMQHWHMADNFFSAKTPAAMKIAYAPVYAKYGGARKSGDSQFYDHLESKYLTTNPLRIQTGKNNMVRDPVASDKQSWLGTWGRANNKRNDIYYTFGDDHVGTNIGNGMQWEHVRLGFLRKVRRCGDNACVSGGDQ